MKKAVYLYPFLLSMLLFVSCQKQDDPVQVTDESLEIHDFIWKGMNLYYLWKPQIADLADNRFNSDQTYTDFLGSYADPATFFEHLIYNRQSVDKWSWIVDDYIALENAFSGISTSNGIEYGLVYEQGSSSDIYGYVRYILPDSDAAGKGIQRGAIFEAIDGVQLTVDNYQELLAANTYTMHFAEWNGGNPISNGITVSLNKAAYQENPVYKAQTLESNGTKIAYLMYNAFTKDFDQALNEAFGQFIADGASELVIDLRYNGGGSIQTATYLAQMITGQFTGEVFVKERWNNELQAYFEESHPEWLVNNFVDKIAANNSPINSLQLGKVYIITSGSSASASELIINGLNPYIEVITVGTTTHGKYTGSVTLYDSDNFSRSGDNLNPEHSWAIQPIVMETLNKLDENSPNGFTPTHELIDHIAQMTALGEPTEPLLSKAIELITGQSGRSTETTDLKTLTTVKAFSDSKAVKRFGNEMYIDKELPLDLPKQISF